MRLASPAMLLVARNLRTGERAPGVAAVRVLVVGLVLMALYFAHDARAMFGGPGKLLLSSISTVDLWTLLLAGVAMFPGLIAEEREQQSLTLLRLAGFGAVGFLLGQTLSAFAQCALVLAVQVPFLMLAVTLGGTSSSQVLLTVLVLFVAMVQVYGASLLAGACARTVRGANRLAVFLVLAVMLLPVWLAQLEKWAIGTVYLGAFWRGPTLLGAVQSDVVEFGPVWRALGLQVGLGAGLALLAVLVFDTRKGEAPNRPRSAASQAPRARFPHGAAAFRVLADRGPSRMARWKVTALVHAALAAFVLILVDGTGSGAFALLVPLQIAVAVLNVSTLATSGGQAVRRERVAGLLLLAGGTHTWLREQRSMRVRVCGMHLLALTLTVLCGFVATLGQSGAQLIGLSVSWCLGALFFADRFGEFCGLTYQRAPLAVTLIGGLTIGVVVNIMGVLAVGVGGAGPAALCLVAVSLFFCLGLGMSAATKARLPAIYAE